MTRKVTAADIDKIVTASENVVNAVTGKFNPPEESLEETLRRDPLAEAENIMDERLVPYGFRELFTLGHSVRVNQHKEKVLMAVDDTTFSNTVERYHRIVRDLGFEKVLEIPFRSTKYDDFDEKLFVFWRADGLLLVHDTFGGSNVNSSHVYFNWKGRDASFPESCSGGYYIKDDIGKVPPLELYPNYELTKDPAVLERDRLWQEKFERESVFVGDFDGREALRHRISQLEKTGSFINPWQVRGHLWFCNYADTETKGFDSKKIAEERIAMLPEYVRRQLG